MDPSPVSPVLINFLDIVLDVLTFKDVCAEI